MANGSDVTIIVPTFNRADFLERLLAYYAAAGFQGTIILGDGSAPEHAALIAQAVGKYSGKLKIEHHHLPGASIAKCLATLNAYIKTSYVTLVGDDDFILVDGLERSVDFIKEHPDYVAAHGKAALLIVENGQVYGKITGFGNYPLKAVESDDPAIRLEQFLKDYSVLLFSVFKRDVWLKMWADVAEVRDVAFGAELIPNAIAAVSGKIKLLDSLYLIRQGHDRRYLVADGYDWVTSPKWQAGHDAFKASVIKNLEEQGIKDNVAEKAIKAGFSVYLNKYLSKAGARKGFTVKLKKLSGIFASKPKLNDVSLKQVYQLITGNN